MTRLNDASQQLDAALARLEGALDTLLEGAATPASASREVEALLTDRTKLADNLDAALEREAELQALADEASSALGSAIEEVRAALVQSGGSDGQG